MQALCKDSGGCRLLTPRIRRNLHTDWNYYSSMKTCVACGRSGPKIMCASSTTLRLSTATKHCTKRLSKRPNGASRMKIALVLDDTLDTPDGVQQYILNVGSWLSEQGHEVHYLV